MQGNDQPSVDCGGSDDSEPTAADEREVASAESYALCVCTEAGTITAVSTAFEALFNTDATEAVGTSLATFLASRTTASVDTLSNTVADAPVSRRLTIKTADGESDGDSVTVDFEMVPVGDGDEPTRLGVCVIDEAGRAAGRSELLTAISCAIGEAESYHAGLAATVEAICTLSEWTYGEVWTPADDGEYLSYTLGYTDDPAAERFQAESTAVTFGFGEGLPGRVYDSQSPEWIPNAAAEPTDVFHRAALAEAADLRAAFGVPVVADGEVVSVLAFFLRERREVDEQLASDITAIVATLSGLIKRKRAEDQLRRQYQQLDAFTDTVSHDLRNPLSVARGYLELAQTEGSEEALEKVSSALARMDELIEDLLLLAEAGRSVDDLEPVSIAEIVQDAWKQVQTDGATLDIDPTLDDQIGRLQADPHRLQQLFENLFRNSVEHGRPRDGGAVSRDDENSPQEFSNHSTSSRTQSGDSVEHGSTSNRMQSGDSVERASTGHIEFDSVIEDADSGLTVRVGPLERASSNRTETALATGFYVADDGPGIPLDERASVFDASYSTGGTGIGLKIVKEIADAHGWDVSCTAARDGGARFEFRQGDLDLGD